MKKIIIFAMLALAIACNTSKSMQTDATKQTAAAGDTIRIANDALEYEIIIIDGGFNSWLQTNARPRGHYTQEYMAMRNQTWVNEWNNRSRNPRFAATFMPIDYVSSIDYGYEVNYLLFNYLTYFQLRNNIKLGGYVPRI